MNYCNSCDIAYEEKYCPLCERNKEVVELELMVEELKDRLGERCGGK